MPRTKVSKSSKRNREAANREEKIRQFDAALHSYINTLEDKGQVLIDELEEAVRLMIQRTNSILLQSRMQDVFALKLKCFTDWSEKEVLIADESVLASSNSTSKLTNPNDEGYLTEDSNGGRSISSGSLASHAAFLNISHLRSQQKSLSQQQQRGRTPGPLSSAKARRNPRRSRSACGDFVPQLLTNLSSVKNTDHSARSKLRTPLPTRSKALSADRAHVTVCTQSSSELSPSRPAFMRWPRAGEIVLSKCGSPVVAQVLPDKHANVNIPIKNGVLSMQPVKLDALNPDIIESISSDTMEQIKTLHANLDIIVNLANMKTFK